MTRRREDARGCLQAWRAGKRRAGRIYASTAAGIAWALARTLVASGNCG